MARMVAKIKLWQDSVPEAGAGIALVRSMFTGPAFALDEATAKRGVDLTIPFNPDLLPPAITRCDGERWSAIGITIQRLRDTLHPEAAKRGVSVAEIAILDEREGARMLADFAAMRAAGMTGTVPPDIPEDLGLD